MADKKMTADRWLAETFRRNAAMFGGWRMEADTSVVEESTTTTVASETSADSEPLGDAGKKALEAERKNARQAAKERDALAARLQEFEDRDKSEAEKVAERAKAAEDRAAQAESKSLRLEVAFEKGLTPAQAKRLVGSTRDELEADADELLETFKPSEEKPPTVDLDLGTRTTTAATSTDPRSADLAQIEADLKANKRR